jgi:hypothetical protein
MAIPIGPLGSDVRARLFLVAHVTGLLVFFLMVCVALIVPRLRLGERALRVLWWSVVPVNYLVVVVFGLIGAIAKFPSLAAPEVPPLEGAVAVIFMSTVALTAIGGLTMCGLLIYGLRGSDAPVPNG